MLVPASAQTPAAGSIQGQVVNALTGAPVRDAVVTLRGPYRTPALLPRQTNAAPAPASVLTAADDRGNFRFANLRAGNYRLTSSHNGLLGRPPENGGAAIELVPLGPDQQLSGVVVKLNPVSAVTGKIVDAAGEPVQNAAVTVVWRGYNIPGQPFYSRVSARVQTDDRGIYWTSGFQAGQFGLKVEPPPALTRPRDSSGLAYTTTYYPDVTDPAAMTTFEVALGATRHVDVKLHQSPVFHIGGRTIGPDGLGTSFGSLQLLRADGSLATGLGDITRADNFDFDIFGVPAGSYLMVTSATSAGQKFFARQAIAVTGNIEDVRLELKPVHELRGSVRIEGKAAEILQGAEIQLYRLNNFDRLPVAMLKNDLSFSFPNVTLGRYTVGVTHLPAAYYVKSVLYDGKEVPATGLDAGSAATLSIVVSAAGAAKLDGKVLDASGNPAAYATVTLFPLDGAALSALTGYSDAHGDFDFAAVRPGQYRALAWEEDGFAPLLQSAGMEALKPLDAWSKVVELKAGGRESIELHWVSSEEKQRVFAAR